MNLYDDLMELARVVTCTILGLNPDDQPQNIVPLDLTDSPGFLTDPHSDFVFYNVLFDNQDINKQIDTTVEDESPVTLSVQTQYTRNLRIVWQTYGDDGFEWADKIRIKLFSNDIRNLLADKGITLITNVPQAQYIPEKIGQQWYKRYDLYANFNQLVTMEETVSAVASAEIDIVDEKGVVSKCSISSP